MLRPLWTYCLNNNREGPQKANLLSATLNPTTRLQAWYDSKIINIVGAWVFNEKGELLLLQRHSDDLGGGQWGTPGGRIEPGESATQAMHREFREETGLDLEPAGFKLTKLGAHLIHMPHGTVHMISYHGKVPAATAIVVDPEEHHAHKWFQVDALVGDPTILYGVPSILRDFELLEFEGADPTLAGGSSVELVS